MKKLLTMFLAVILALGCAVALVACGSGDDGKDTNKGNDGQEEQLTYSIYGTFFYEQNGSQKDAKGATWKLWVDDGNKFHLYGTLAHSDNTTSTIEFEGQVVNVTQYTLQCAQVMFFNYTYHGVAYKPADCGARQATVNYKNAWAEEYGSSDYNIYLVRKTNDGNVDGASAGNAGTFYAQEGWDIAEGVWDITPTGDPISA